jgi:hypothetical protein
VSNRPVCAYCGERVSHDLLVKVNGIPYHEDCLSDLLDRMLDELVENPEEGQ